MKKNPEINPYIKKFAKNYKKVKSKPAVVPYTLYKPNQFAKISNRFVEPITLLLLRKFPELFKPLFNSLKLIRLNMLSESYVSIMIFSSILAFFVGTILFSIILKNILNGLGLGVLSLFFTVILFFFYPKSNINSRRKKIKSELPFAIIHMAAIAGSGTPPINIFSLLIQSKEYPELETEFKKIMNHINIFGYDLSTALKSVASTCPSPEFGELLNGIVSTVNSGGDLKTYLETKAQDALSTYKLERQKYVESIATYSDIYTGILIAAPLLFITTLAIINVIGGAVGGLTATVIAQYGTFLVLPILNVGFIAFLNLTATEI
ncbi:MAG: type II secretion system F family protein [Candidatus Nanoarchaeia archaeon]